MCSLKCGYCGTLSLSAFLIEFSAYLADQMLNEILWSFIIYIPSIWNLLSSEFLFWKRHVPFEQRQSISTTRFVSNPGGQLNIILKYMLGNIYKNDKRWQSLRNFDDSHLRKRLRKSLKLNFLENLGISDIRKIRKSSKFTLCGINYDQQKTVSINSWPLNLLFPKLKSKYWVF